MANKRNLKGKFVVVFDTIVDGHQTAMDGHEQPILHDSYDEAFREIFDDAHSMMFHKTEEELEEYHEGVTPELVAEMGRILKADDVEAMKKFLSEHPECNENNEWVEEADKFQLGHKTIFTGK